MPDPRGAISEGGKVTIFLAMLGGVIIAVLLTVLFDIDPPHSIIICAICFFGLLNYLKEDLK